MTFYKVNSNDYEALYEKLACEKAGAKIISKKSNINTLYIKDLHTGAANILKQDALSIGADLAVPRGTILNTTKTVDAILVGTNKHFEILSKKELSQPFGLKLLAQELKDFIPSKKSKTKIMGVINANDDSFYENSRFKNKDAISKIKQMIIDGADIIDIGAVSSKPGSIEVSSKEELERIKPICDEIKTLKLYEEVTFSIDSYSVEVIEYALKSGFSIVNDITGLEDDKVAKVTAKYDASIVIMHMLNKPSNMQDNPKYDNVVLEIDKFFKQRIQKAKEFGIKNIILDVGIGFGKTLEYNLELLNNLEHFSHFGYEVLLGASRKSLIDMIVPNTPASQRLAGTLVIHLDGIKKGASIIRCHDVKEHFQAIQVQEAINKVL
ncbi:MAG TPA: dihydropteroate synthase [Arcobacter sp.]|nr:dihydropteroate synthase [Arcobacter sp.]HIP56004.1 dihydropteroate synthase [Arcobacter sp.]